jgi:hypothetical protein
MIAAEEALKKYTGAAVKGVRGLIRDDQAEIHK